MPFRFALLLCAFLTYVAAMSHFSYVRHLNLTRKPTHRRIQLYRILAEAASRRRTPVNHMTKEKPSQESIQKDKLELIYPKTYNVIGFGKK
ncbi:hypothetical protein L596_020513 [Steinernema carpocapsae]|uniref:Uncharacterized protein n=1 Tax=Steinernema carpocapsae TaxID=34508 RepID=A0A4U5MUI7_STECR|nr:hypothetical protein L596_020513 [Steinernema carpocapsae]